MGPFNDIFDFCERVDHSAQIRRAIETLIKAGAFDWLGAQRISNYAVIERAIQSGASLAADRKSGQKSLFGGFDEEEAAAPAAALPDVPEWPDREKAQYEKEVLGFYLSSPSARRIQDASSPCTARTPRPISPACRSAAK